MTTKRHVGAYMLVVVGIAAIAASAMIFSGRAAALAAGVAVAVLGIIRYAAPQSIAISSRSRAFDTLLLIGLGAAILVLALTADNL